MKKKQLNGVIMEKRRVAKKNIVLDRKKEQEPERESSIEVCKRTREVREKSRDDVYCSEAMVHRKVRRESNSTFTTDET